MIEPGVLSCPLTGVGSGLLLVLSAPSGAGKTTVAQHLLARHSNSTRRLERSVSVTTRPPRPGEIDQEDYCFVSRAEFAALQSRGELLETAELYGHQYGTPRAFVEERLRQGTDVLLVLDATGRQQLAARYSALLVSVFLLPPSREELERRLRGRANEEDEAITRRLQAAAAEMAQCDQYDYVLVNRDLPGTLACLEVILRAERLRRRPVAAAGRCRETTGNP